MELCGTVFGPSLTKFAFERFFFFSIVLSFFRSFFSFSFFFERTFHDTSLLIFSFFLSRDDKRHEILMCTGNARKNYVYLLSS